MEIYFKSFNSVFFFVVWLKSYLIMGQHVQSLPVPFDLCGDILVLQDHALSPTLTPLCNRTGKNKTKQWEYYQSYSHSANHLTILTFYSYLFPLLRRFCFCPLFSVHLSRYLSMMLICWYKCFPFFLTRQLTVKVCLLWQSLCFSAILKEMMFCNRLKSSDR